MNKNIIIKNRGMFAIIIAGIIVGIIFYLNNFNILSDEAFDRIDGKLSQFQEDVANGEYSR